MAFQEKVVLITGASRGIGLATARAFAAQRAKVVLVARDAGLLEEVEDELYGSGADVLAVPADISDPTSVQALGREVVGAYGRVDILINNAAVATFKPLLESTPSEWRAMTGTNLHGLFAVTQCFLKGMVERRAGVIVNVSAAVARNGYPNLAVYSATKAGIIAFGEALAREVRRYNVQVYTLCPHGVDTDLYRSLFGEADPAKLLTPERVASEILSLAEGASDLRSGQTREISVEK